MPARKKYKNKSERSKAEKEQDKIYRRQWRKDNPIMYQWQRLRMRAKQRGKTCGITLEEFTEWCIGNNYHLLAGPYAGDMTIDREKNEIGYEKGNLRMCKRTHNSSKGTSDREIPYDENVVLNRWKPIEGDDLPF